jgi:hypothetical protein
MKKIKGFVFSEKKLAGAIFGFLAITAFSLVFGPNIYAQFARQDNTTGWGNGYGYGYGYGYGFDGGTFAGYKTTGNPSTFGYGFGYGYVDAATSYSALNGYSVTPSSMATLVQGGVMVPNGSSITNTTAVSFTDKVTLNVASGVTISIPSGTTFTSGSSANFSNLAAANDVSTSGLSNVTVAGSALSFGMPNFDLTVSPAITITLNVGSGHDGQNLNIYRKDANGTWSNVGACTVSGTSCTFATTHLSSFVAGNTSSNGGGGGGGGTVAQACTSVVYGDFAANCFVGYQYRSIASRTPSNCSLTAAQIDAARRACTTEIIGGVPTTVVTGTTDNSGFLAAEKNLVKKINKALAKRLSGRILLQVQAQGQSWYVNPINGLKYYLGTADDAFLIMKKLALGVNNKTFATFKNGKAPARLAGRILLKVQDSGKAYYVNPIDLKMYYLGRPADAYSIMRKLGLGITNANLRQIGIGEVK